MIKPGQTLVEIAEDGDGDVIRGSDRIQRCDFSLVCNPQNRQLGTFSTAADRKEGGKTNDCGSEKLPCHREGPKLSLFLA